MLEREYIEFETQMPYLKEATLKFHSSKSIPEREFWRSVVLGMRELCRERWEAINAGT